MKMVAGEFVVGGVERERQQKQSEQKGESLVCHEARVWREIRAMYKWARKEGGKMSNEQKERDCVGK